MNSNFHHKPSAMLLRFPAALLTLLLFLSCSHNVHQQTKIKTLSDSSLYTNNGKMLLKKGNFTLALQEFDKAIKIKPHDNNAHIGKALVLLKLHKLREAFQELEHAEKHASGTEEKLKVISAKIQYYASPPFVRLHHGKDAWFVMSRQEFEKAAKIKKSNEIYYEMAIAYRMNFMFDKAEELLHEVTSTNNPFTIQAGEELETIRLSKPIAQSYPDVKPLLFQGELHRDQLAFLLTSLFSIDKKKRLHCNRKEEKEASSGNAEEGNNRYITRVLSCSLRGLGMMRDGSFHEKELVSRADFAFVLSELYHRVHPEDRDTPSLQHLPSFSDVQNNDWFAQSVSFVHRFGLMHEKDRLTMEFRPYGSINMVEAMVILDHFFTSLL